MAGLFVVSKSLFSIDILSVDGVDTWHPDVRFYHVLDNGEHIASFYFDLFARANKRGGAWMADCRVRRQTDGGVQRPVAFLTCKDRKSTRLNSSHVANSYAVFC